MSVTALLGLQWGDEGKGKIVDALSGSLDIIVRAQGGANAGHTVIAGTEKHVLHLIPSGILYPHVVGVIGNGVVVDPLQLVNEIDELRTSGCDVDGRLWLSDRAHMVLPYHKVVDACQESQRGGSALGTTGRGIGPAYQDKAARSGIRAGEMLDEARFTERVRAALEAKRASLPPEAGAMLDETLAMDELLAARSRLVPLIRDSVAYLHDALSRDQDILLEGAQGTMLDVDLGTYPFVTSSNCQMGGMLAGSGLPPSSVARVIGVAKAYCTRVGAGPFPTEEEGPIGEAMRKKGSEFGATTGRPRRCGWFDSVATRYAVRVNGVTDLAVTKVDVLSGQPEIKVATSYELDGSETRDFPAGDALDRVKPIYDSVPGFDTSLDGVTEWDDLPSEVHHLVAYMEEVLSVHAFLVSTGPKREETVMRS